MADYTKSQQKALKAFLSGQNIYLTGKAGTGKSWLTEHIIDIAEEQRKSVLICAPTGVAAVNIGGQTIHRALSMHPEILAPGYTCQNPLKKEVLRRTDLVIMDEISMCRLDVFTAFMNTLLEATKESKRQKQLLFVGDFYQLPPVITKRDMEIYGKLYGGLFAFESPLWDKAGLKTHELKENMRQKDLHLAEILDSIREGRPDLYYLNNNAGTEPDPDAISICTTNARATQINESALEELKDKKYTFNMFINGTVENSDMCVEKTLTLAKGARVMTVTNDPDDEYVNGSLGTVVDIDPENRTVTVKMDHTGKEVPIAAYEWKVYDYSLAKAIRQKKQRKGIKTTILQTETETINKKEIGSYIQLPLRHAWAITIHKSQGQTYDKVNIFAKDRFFAPGQLYVALSRCRTLEGTNIIGHIPASAVKVDPVVKAFMEGRYKVNENTLL